MSTFELLDELEAGELSVRFEGEEPQALLEWAIAEFAPRIALSAAFQADDGRLPDETHELIARLRDRYPGLKLDVLTPEAKQVQRLISTKGLDLMKESVENRLLCCNVRKVQPLTKHLGGLDAWITGLRRDQWATRTNIRKVEIDHDHGAIVKLNPLAEWTKDEVPTHALYEQGYTSIGCAPCTRAIGPGEDDRAGRWWWETNAPKECGMHCSIEHGGFEHELHAILGDDVNA